MFDIIQCLGIFIITNFDWYYHLGICLFHSRIITWLIVEDQFFRPKLTLIDRHAVDKFSKSSPLIASITWFHPNTLVKMSPFFDGRHLRQGLLFQDHVSANESIKLKWMPALIGQLDRLFLFGVIQVMFCYCGCLSIHPNKDEWQRHVDSLLTSPQRVRPCPSNCCAQIVRRLAGKSDDRQCWLNAFNIKIKLIAGQVQRVEPEVHTGTGALCCCCWCGRC